MHMLSRRWTIASLVGVLSLTFAAGCGDNSNTEQVDAAPDTGVPDAGEVDASPHPDQLRSGTIAVVDVRLTNPGLEAFSGASVVVSYNDLQDPVPAPVYGTNPPPLGDCIVRTYVVGEDVERPVVDEGSVTIEGTRSPVGTCTFDAGAGAYRCKAGTGTVGMNSTVTANANGTVTIAFFNEVDFPALQAAGMYVELSGFQTAVYNGRFPVVATPTESILVVANPAAIGTAPEAVADTEPAWTLYAGEGPTPAGVEFLGNEGDTVTITKEAGPIVTTFSAALKPSGAGLQLAGNSAWPHAIVPETTGDVVFSCASADGGNCGAAGGLVVGFVLSGYTTDASLEGIGPTTMPPAVSRYSTFQCRGVPGSDTITLKEGALAALLESSPTRISTQLLRITADLTKPQTSVVVGHGLVGFTDVPVAE